MPGSSQLQNTTAPGLEVSCRESGHVEILALNARAEVLARLVMTPKQARALASRLNSYAGGYLDVMKDGAGAAGSADRDAAGLTEEAEDREGGKEVALSAEASDPAPEVEADEPSTPAVEPVSPPREEHWTTERGVPLPVLSRYLYRQLSQSLQKDYCWEGGTNRYVYRGGLRS